MRHPHPKVPRPWPRHKLLPALLLPLLLLPEPLLQLVLLQLLQLGRGEARNATQRTPKQPCQALLLAGLLHALSPDRHSPHAHCCVRRQLPSRHCRNLMVLLRLLVRGPVRCGVRARLLLLLRGGHAWYGDQLAAQVPPHELQHQPLNSCPCARHKPAHTRTRKQAEAAETLQSLAASDRAQTNSCMQAADDVTCSTLMLPRPVTKAKDMA